MSVHSNKEDDKSFHSTDEEYDQDEITEDDEDDDLDDEDDDDQDEPKLRYRRVGASLKEILEKDTASTLRVSERFVVKINTLNTSLCINSYYY
jgi:hypothetical protein